MVDTTGRPRIEVERDGEEIEVWNEVTVQQEHHINSINGYETFHGPVRPGDQSHGDKVGAVTPRIARLLDEEFMIDVAEQDIEVIDPDDEEVHIL